MLGYSEKVEKGWAALSFLTCVSPERPGRERGEHVDVPFSRATQTERWTRRKKSKEINYLLHSGLL